MAKPLPDSEVVANLIGQLTQASNQRVYAFLVPDHWTNLDVARLTRAINAVLNAEDKEKAIALVELATAGVAE